MQAVGIDLYELAAEQHRVQFWQIVKRCDWIEAAGLGSVARRGPRRFDAGAQAGKRHGEIALDAGCWNLVKAIRSMCRSLS